jgi:hypothetical protein
VNRCHVGSSDRRWARQPRLASPTGRHGPSTVVHFHAYHA